MADVKVVTADNFQDEVLNADVPVLVDFWAVWCGPCKMLTPVVHEIAAEHPEIKVCSVNVDDEMELAQKFNIMSIPTLLVFNKGEMVDQMVGLQPKNVIEQKIAL
ncbi:MAG: thioredoxin [Blautia sp.]|nr:thioredoxin [Blautia sp.]